MDPVEWARRAGIIDDNEELTETEKKVAEMLYRYHQYLKERLYSLHLRD